MEQNEKTLCGIVDNITYRNAENGYCVFDLECDGQLITVTGIMPELCAGEQVTLRGIYTMHPTYGEQFKAQLCERNMPATEGAILRYLSSGAIRGVGPVTASHIVEKFGDRSLEVIENEPERLAKIRGISKSKAMQIGEEYRKQFGIREVMIKLSELDITSAEALRIYNKLGAACVDVIMSNPYSLCSEGIGLGFVRADEICARLPNSVPAVCRIKAAIEYILRHNLGNGHTCIPRDKLVPTAVKMLVNYDCDTVEAALDDMLDAGTLEKCTIDEKEFIFLSYMYKAERYCANRIALMLKLPPSAVAIHENRLSQFESENGIIYDESQRRAIGLALTGGLMVLTGGPGTGKTTILNAIISLIEESGGNIALAAPTGRAAKRMSELTNHEAKTIHRLLEVEWGDNDKPHFRRNDENPLDADVVIVDELSMMDVTLFSSLLKAMSASCRLILVGDVDQLPSVGAGNVLGDLIDSGAVPTVRLTKVFRQAKESFIVTNAHRIINGEMPVVENAEDFFVANAKSGDNAASIATELYCSRLPGAYGFDPINDIQILCPSKKRQGGTVAINMMIQSAINPPAKNKHEITRNGMIMREGDKIMQIHNNYDVNWTRDDGEEGSGVYNGDIGILSKVDPALGVVTVRFDDKTAMYSGEQIDDLELAYAVTVHKSQGSEFDCVILPVCDIPPALCYRNLLYTALTRAKKMLIIIGTGHDIKLMIDNNVKTRRYTAFGEFLRTALDGGEYL